MHKPDFQQVLAVFYADILEFHRRAYKFFRRRGMEQPLQAERYHANKVLGWTFFFKSSWAQFDGRFNHIIADLARHSDLVDKEASALSIEQTNEWRKRWLEEVTAKENKTSASHLKAAISWLEGASLNQEDNLDSWAENCHPGSCDWIHKHAKMKAWTRQGADNPILWLNGKPGSGKSP